MEFEVKKLNNAATTYAVNCIMRDLLNGKIQMELPYAKIIRNSVRNGGKYEVSRLYFHTDVKEAEIVYQYIRHGAFNATREVNRLLNLPASESVFDTVIYKEAKKRKRQFKEAENILKAALEEYYSRMNSTNFQ